MTPNKINNANVAEQNTEALKEELLDDDDWEWCRETDWDTNLSICGKNLTGCGPSIPNSEVPDDQMCPKCLSVSKSQLYKRVTSPLMRFKVWLIG